MRLLMWQKGGKHIHAHNSKSQNSINTDSDRLIFYDERGSTTYDKQTDTWYKDGVQFTPSFPLSFVLHDGRSVKVDKKGGKHTWQVQP